MKNNFIWAAGSVVAAVVICLVLLGTHAVKFGAITSPATNQDYLQLSQGLQIPAGPSVNTSLQGTNLQAVITGTCNPTFYGTTLAATSSGVFACPNTAVVAGDKVFVMLPAGAGASPGAGLPGSPTAGFDASAGFATTTGIIGFNIQNFTGAATTSFAQATTGIQYLIIR